MMFAREPLTADNWPAAFRLLEPAMKRCGSTPEELIDQFLDGTADLWILRKGGDPVAAAMSEVVETPQGKLVHGRLLGGGYVDEAIAAVRAHAREVGAKTVRIEGRMGWKRKLESRGWRQAGVIMELSDGR